jgi:hypothetical protein
MKRQTGATLQTCSSRLQASRGRTLAGFGQSLGATAAAAQEHNDEMGLLYTLRNAKNPRHSTACSTMPNFRLEVAIPEVLLKIEKGERIAGVSWVWVKTILSICAMNAYLRKGGAAEGSPAASEATASV